MEEHSDSSLIETDEESDSGSKRKFLWAQKDSYGYTYGDSKADRLKNFKSLSTFRLTPIADIPDEKYPSMLFLVTFELSQRQYKITILDPDLYDFKKCLAKVVAMCPVELVQGSVPQKDFKEMQEEHIRLWHKNAYSRKYPVTNLGLQRHILPRSYKDWKATDLEWFFHEDLGILGIDGKMKADPKSVFVSELMEQVPQIKCELSGYEGWKRHLEPPYTSDMGGEIYMESVCCSANIAHLTFHGMMFREIWGKLGMICVAGRPNMAKTKDIMSALHMASSRQFFYAMKATPEFLQMMCEKIGLMLAYDDNDSLRREEVLGVSRFEGAAIGTKTSGVKLQVGELVLTSNLDAQRTDKMKQGRIQVIRKCHAGYEEDANSLQALDNLADLNAALTDPNKPLDFMVRSWSFWFIMVKIPEDLKDGYKKNETEASQMRIWFSMSCKRVREITGHSIREVFTISALNLFPFLYDKLCPADSEWHKNGGATFYMSVYLPRQCAGRAQLYAKPLEVPTVPTIDLFGRFIVFVRQLKDGIGERLEGVKDEKVLTAPGDFVKEVRIVQYKAKNGELDLFLAISRSEDFCQSYGTTDGIATFLEFIKKQDGFSDVRYSYKKKTITAAAISMKFFEPLLRKRLFQKLMRQKIALPSRHYSSSVRRQGSVRMRREAEVNATDNSDYEDTEADTVDEENGEETSAGILSPIGKASSGTSDSRPVTSGTSASRPVSPGTSAASGPVSSGTSAASGLVSSGTSAASGPGSSGTSAASGLVSSGTSAASGSGSSGTPASGPVSSGTSAASGPDSSVTPASGTSASEPVSSGTPVDQEAEPTTSFPQGIDESSHTEANPSGNSSSVADMVAGSKEAMTELPEGVLQTTSENLGLVAPVDSALPNPNLEPAPSPIPGCSKANLATLAANQVGSLAKGLEEELLRSPIPSLSTSTMPSSQVPTTPPAHSNECNTDDLLGMVQNFTDTLAGQDVSTFFDPADALGLSRSQERTPVGVAMFRKKASAIACNKTKPSAARKRLSISKDAVAPEGFEMTRTRSQSKSVSAEIQVGDEVMAHKGRKVQFWFPGKITKKKAKTYTVAFLAVFGSEDCSRENIITVEEYKAQKALHTAHKLFKIPEEYSAKFEETFSTISRK